MMNKSINIASVALSVTIIELYLQVRDVFGRKGADAFMQLAFGRIWNERLKRLLNNAVNIAGERITNYWTCNRCGHPNSYRLPACEICMNKRGKP